MEKFLLPEIPNYNLIDIYESHGGYQALKMQSPNNLPI